MAESLFFVLFQIKNDLIWGSLGCVFNMAGSTAHENFDRFSGLLEQTLEKKVLLKRSFESVEEFEAHLTGAAEIIFDGTENAKERPKGYEKQKDSYKLMSP